MPLFGKKLDKKAQRQKGKQQQPPPQKVVLPTSKENKGSPWQGTIDDGTAAIHQQHGVDETDGARSGPRIGGAESFQRSLSDEEGKLGDLGAGKLGNIRAGGGKNLLTAYQSTNRSRLSNTLPEVLRDNTALPYFIQFMESARAVQLVQFWVSVESFSTATWSSSNVLSGSQNTNSDSSQQNQDLADIPQNKEPTSNLTNNTGKSKDETNDNGGVLNTNESNLPPRIQVTAETPTDPAGCGSSNNNDSEKPQDGLPKGNSVMKENSPNNTSPAKANKTHIRARSDSSAMDLSKIASKNSNMDNGSDSRHRRNNSVQSWKDVDPKTAVERDAINIYTKFLCKDAPSPIGIPEEIRMTIIARICPSDGMVDPDCFKEPQQFAYELMETEYFPKFLRGIFHCKYQVDILTSGKVYLADILYNETATSYLMEYLEHEGAIHLLQFWLAATNFRQHFVSQQGQYDPQQAQDDAMVLYDQYFSLQALHPLGFNNETRFSVESNICREGGPLPDCFEVPMRQAFNTLESVYFPGFLQSQLHYQFLSELLNSIRSESKASSIEDVTGVTKSTDPPKLQHRNTLLAEGSVKKLLQSDMSIDPMQFNPDSLWQRSNSGSIASFGKMDSLGQFVSGFEPDPESLQKRSAGSRFSLKKLVNKEEAKAKEQMALQIAQMIINDVTVQTQAASANTSSSS